MNLIPVVNNLRLPHDGTESKVRKLVAGKTQILNAPSVVPAYETLWTARWWGLDKSSVFSNMTKTQQSAVLSGCNQNLLTEAYFIEKSGLAYCAKMTLLAECTDVAQLYSLIGADEAKHLAWIEPYLSVEQKQLPDGHFLAFLSQLIEQCSAQSLIYLVQIILEGWGLDHYQRLSKGCEEPHLANVFALILKDEALHHRSGDLLFDKDKIASTEMDAIHSAIKTYTDLVRVGPQMVVGVVDKIAGGLTIDEIIEVLSALEHDRESRRKLALMKSLMSQPGMESAVQELELEGQFVPLTLESAAEFFQANR